jgi:diguanylate cyclase (GGDEF)-like protein
MVACSAIGIINILDWSLFNGSIYTIFMFLEVLLVGCLWKKRQRNLFVLDAFYWGIIGGPFATLVFYMIRGTVNVEGLLIVSNIVINGLINVFLADILISYIPIQRIFGYRDKGHIDLNKMIFHLTVAAVLGPFLAYTFVDTWFSKASLELDIFQNMNSTKVNITEKLKTWEDSDFQKLRLKSPIYINRFKTALSSNPLNNSVEVLLADNKSNIYFTSNEDKYGKNYNWRECGVYLEIDDNVYEWYPEYSGVTTDLSRWSKAFYIMIIPFNSVDIQLQIKVPLSQYAEDVWKTYLNKFLILLFFCFVSAIISTMTSTFVSRDLSKLTKSSTGLPEKLKRQEVIEWPRTSISQVNSLVSNFQVMSDNLVDLFTEAKIMNNQLLSQTKELELSREKMKHLAYNDVLTGLPNRLSFNVYLENLLNTEQSRNLAVMFIDLNRFKHINDTLGHEYGDMLIKEVAKRLSYFLKDDSFVARLGGDEFVVVLNNADMRRAKKSAIYINKILTEPFFINQDNEMHELYVSASVGISMCPEDAFEKSTLLKYADLAMYAAKESGDNTFRFYSEITKSNMAEKLLLEQSLCKALERKEIIIYYQPKVNVQTKEITGMEALIRWNHPQRGMISPAQFIPLAEETGIINQIGEWVLIEACKQTKKWQDMGFPKMRISVNLSIRQFYGNNIVRLVSKALDISGLEPKYLELEITEGFLIKNTKYIISILQEVRDMGVYISIDDFGIGYSSFCRLKELPVQILKIDKSLITDILKEKMNGSIVKAIIELAHSMGLKVVAEGVETIEEFHSLALLECDEIQGYLFSEPLPVIEFEKLVRSFEFWVDVTN